MNWTIPGTAQQVDAEDTGKFKTQLESICYMGGITLGQIVQLTGLEPYRVQNWVRRGFLAPPVSKRYGLNQVCRILNIHMMESTLTMERICSLLSYVNGQLNDESDDLIDDAALYFLFLDLAKETPLGTPEGEIREKIKNQLKNRPERAPGGNHRVEEVLLIMLTAWQATELRHQAEKMVESLSGKETT